MRKLSLISLGATLILFAGDGLSINRDEASSSNQRYIDDENFLNEPAENSQETIKANNSDNETESSQDLLYLLASVASEQELLPEINSDVNRRDSKNAEIIPSNTGQRTNDQVHREVKREPSDTSLLRGIKQEPSGNQVYREVKQEASTSSNQEETLHNAPLYPNDDKLYNAVKILKNYRNMTDNDFESVLYEEGDSLKKKCNYTIPECKKIRKYIDDFYTLKLSRKMALKEAILKRRNLDNNNKRVFKLDQNNEEDQKLLSLIFKVHRDLNNDSNAAKFNKKFRLVIRTILGQDTYYIRKEEKPKKLAGIDLLARTWAILANMEKETKVKSEDTRTNKRPREQDQSKSFITTKKRVRKESRSQKENNIIDLTGEDIIDLTEEDSDKKVSRPTKNKGKQPIIDDSELVKNFV